MGSLATPQRGFRDVLRDKSLRLNSIPSLVLFNSRYSEDSHFGYEVSPILCNRTHDRSVFECVVPSASSWSGRNGCPGRIGLPSIEILDTPLLKYPGGHNPSRRADFLADCNSPRHWSGDTLYVFNSWEQFWRSSGP